MPDQTPPPAQGASPFEIVTPGKSKKGGNRGVIVAIVIVVFLILSVIAGVLLVRQQQQISEKAAGGTAAQCPAAEACPYSKDRTLLRNCTPPEADNSPQDSICNTAGRVESCGGVQYCCPAPGSAWTANMSACAATPSPTASPTASPTVAPTSTPTGTPVPTLQATTQATSIPVPVTGVEWPTVVGVGVGAAAIIVSILIAL